jgi:hypothetical protein
MRRVLIYYCDMLGYIFETTRRPKVTSVVLKEKMPQIIVSSILAIHIRKQALLIVYIVSA